MFKWYASAAVCYAYLADVTEDNESTEFESSRWFTRSWTLQELITPRRLIFFDKHWHRLKAVTTCPGRIANITLIDRALLCRRSSLPSFDVSTRMSWASGRSTKRDEDQAYCLMGLFDVNMPLLYGEGGEKAFARLQRVIITRWQDQSILAWFPDYDPPGFIIPQIYHRRRLPAPTPSAHFVRGFQAPFLRASAANSTQTSPCTAIRSKLLPRRDTPPNILLS